jgi:small subunit ribosomal protein S16
VAVRLRLRRIGKKKQPQYRLVAAESAGPRDGRFIEVIGHYNPRVHPSAMSVNEERALWWLQRGAQPSDTAKSILVKTGVWEKFSGEVAKYPQQPEAAPAAEESEPESSNE